MTVEEIYNWIQTAFEKTSANPQAIINCWAIIVLVPRNSKEDELKKEDDPIGVLLDLSEVFDLENNMEIEEVKLSCEGEDQNKNAI